MGWSRKKRGAARGYYYRSVRVGDSVRLVYLGKGTAAEEAAAEIACRRRQRSEAQVLLRTEVESVVEADLCAAELHEWAETMALAKLLTTGHHLHHGCWRRKRMSKKRAPRVGSKAWEEALYQDPGFVGNMIQDLTKRAAKGDRDAAASLEHWLAKHPEYRPIAPRLTDLMEKAEDVWIRAVTAGDATAGQAVRDEVAKMKGELLASSEGGILERVLSSSVAVNYLAQQHAAMKLLEKTEHSSIASFRELRWSISQKRFHAAMKMWLLIQTKKSVGVAVSAPSGFLAESGQTSNADCKKARGSSGSRPTRSHSSRRDRIQR